MDIHTDNGTDERNGWGKWLALTTGLTLAALTGLGITVAAVDPFFHYHKPLKGLAYPIDSERYQNDGISRHFTYDAVLTGTSMTENFKASLFDRLFGVECIKIPFGGGYYKEVDLAIRRAITYNPQVKLVFRSLDKSFLMFDKDAWNQSAPDPDYLYDANPWNDVKYLWNKEVIFGNVQGVFNYTRNGGQTTGFDDYMRWGPEKEWGTEAVLNTYSRPREYAAALEFTEEDREMVLENLEQNVVAVARDNPQITFIYFIPPYSISYWESELLAKGEFDRQIAALRLMADTLLQYDNIQLYAFDDQYDITCDLDQYMDVIHYSEEVGDRLLEWMADGAHRLTRENAGGYFDRITEFYRNYDYNKIYE